MTHRTARHAARSRRPVREVGLGLAVLTAAGLLVAAVAVTTGGATPSENVADAPARGAETSARPSGSVLAATAPRTGSVAPERPRRAVLPSGTTVPVVPVSTTKDGTLDVPADVDVSGWWRNGSRIGDPFGAVLVSAHVDSTTEGLGPYAELLGVTSGQTVVLTSQHLRQEYEITSLRLLDKGPLSDHPWVYSATGPHRLVMVTCAGPFDPDKGGYQRLAVVTATAVGRPTPRSA